jgi:hypothetical protein
MYENGDNQSTDCLKAISGAMDLRRPLVGSFFSRAESLKGHPQQFASVGVGRKARQKGFLLFVSERTSQKAGDVVFVQLGMFDRAWHGIRCFSTDERAETVPTIPGAKRKRPDTLVCPASETELIGRVS